MTRAFSFLFFFISSWIGLSAVFSYIVFIFNFNYSFHFVIWVSAFIFSLSVFFKPILSTRKSFRERFSTSVSWPPFVKLINGLTWALPFILIPFFQKDYPFLLLTGLSSGNLSTFIFLRRYSKINSIEQMVTGSVLLSSLFCILILYYIYSVDYELILFASRLLISLSYGLGGIVGYFKEF
ncbi:MAG: hypothetical protein H0X50_00085 [Nitrosopumilus sp.]|nr:hypothetical protein [Nitrosopumilus sp.]